MKVMPVQLLTRTEAHAGLRDGEAGSDPRWVEICGIADLAPLGSRVVNCSDGTRIALFRTQTDQVFALLDQCPHKGGPLSQGIVFGERVACPLHNWTIELASGAAVAPDEGCVRRYAVNVVDGRVWLDLRDHPLAHAV